jgi:hypothetical protein
MKLTQAEAERILLTALGGVRPDIGDSLQFTREGLRFRKGAEGGGGLEIDLRSSDPGSPATGELWIRSDFSPPVLRFFNGSQVHTLGVHIDEISESAPPVDWTPEGGVGALWLQIEGE